MCVGWGLGQAITVLADMDRDTLTAGEKGIKILHLFIAFAIPHISHLF